MAKAQMAKARMAKARMTGASKDDPVGLDQTDTTNTTAIIDESVDRDGPYAVLTQHLSDPSSSMESPHASNGIEVIERWHV